MSSSDHASKAAELAAQQVESIVAAAAEAAADIEAGAEKKLEAQRAQLEAEFASRRQARGGGRGEAGWGSRRQALEEEIGRIRKEALAAAEKARAEAEQYATSERSS